MSEETVDNDPATEENIGQVGEVRCTEIPDMRAAAQAKRDELAKEAKSFQEGVAKLEALLKGHRDALLATNGAIKVVDELLSD